MESMVASRGRWACTIHHLGMGESSERRIAKQNWLTGILGQLLWRLPDVLHLNSERASIDNLVDRDRTELAYLLRRRFLR